MGLKLGGGGLGIAAISYIAIDYLREISPLWHSRLQPALWSILCLIALSRVPFYKHWASEFRYALPFLASIVFLLSALLYEALSVRFVTAVLGLHWHRDTAPLPDTGQWLLLALNEKLPETVVDILRAHVVGLHHFLMLFIMLGFSVLFDSVKAPGLGLGARYLFTMAIGRLLRAITFVSTILPSARPWCAAARFKVPAYPHHWAQKYYVPYASDASAIRQLLKHDLAYADPGELLGDYRPDWGSMSFLIDFLRPTPSEGSTWYHLLKKAGGGCNDLLYSGHMLVAVLTAMAWTEAYGGFSSALVWLLVMHSAQREIRERHHYSVDCIVAIYVGILLWKMTERQSFFLLCLPIIPRPPFPPSSQPSTTITIINITVITNTLTTTVSRPTPPPVSIIITIAAPHHHCSPSPQLPSITIEITNTIATLHHCPHHHHHRRPSPLPCPPSSSPLPTSTITTNIIIIPLSPSTPQPLPPPSTTTKSAPKKNPKLNPQKTQSTQKSSERELEKERSQKRNWG